jgi:hypothetical protein
MGTIARNVVGGACLAWGEALLLRVPIFRAALPLIKMLIDAFSPERRGSFKAVVLVQHPREGAWAFGFVTSELSLEAPDGKGEMMTVFVPTNNLYLGDIVMVPRLDVIFNGAQRRGRAARDPVGGTATPDRLPKTWMPALVGKLAEWSSPSRSLRSAAGPGLRRRSDPRRPRS